MSGLMGLGGGCENTHDKTGKLYYYYTYRANLAISIGEILAIELLPKFAIPEKISSL